MIVGAPPLSQLFVRLAPVVVGVAVLVWRVRETRAPVTARRILLPPLGMSTGFAMFAVPETRIPLSWGGVAFLVGAVFLAEPLIRSSKLYLRDHGEIFLVRSNGFLVILVALVGLRVALHDYVGHFIAPGQTAGLFFVLAFGMVLRWRAVLYRRYRSLEPG